MNHTIHFCRTQARAAEEKKLGVREQLALIRAEFEELLADNAARSEAERLPRSEFEMDPGEREQAARIPPHQKHLFGLGCAGPGCEWMVPKNHTQTTSLTYFKQVSYLILWTLEVGVAAECGNICWL